MLDETLTPEEQAALHENVDLDVELRRTILLLCRDTARRDHYSLLGIARDADKKAVKRAYYDLAARLHPDRYFRKNLGSYKLRMEAVFSRVTLAHDTLTKADKRAEYDAYLREQQQSRSIEELLADALVEVKRAEEKAKLDAGTPSEPRLAAAPQPQAGVPQAPPARSITPMPRSLTPIPGADAAARQALARRLLGGRSMPASSRPPPKPNPAAPATTADAMDALRRRYEDRIAAARNAQTRKYVANAEAALAAKDVVGAANAFRVAVSLSPSDAALIKRAQETQAKADELLSETYTRQAGYEEKNAQWAEAAKSWMRVCKMRPSDGRPHERAANAVVKSDGDLHEASRLAQQACALDPHNAQYRLTLASVYLAAGLTLNARRELDTAAQISPHNPAIVAMLKRIDKPA